MKKCTERLTMGDMQDVPAITFHCMLPEGHDGPHIEKGIMYLDYPYLMSWTREPVKRIEEEISNA